MPSLRATALTDIGRVRRENEDRFVCDPKLLLFGVADGIGGLPGGAEAADLAIREVTNRFRQEPPDADRELVEVVQQANRVVGELGVKLSPATGIGTTLTIGCIRGQEIHIAHVGDSRCYVAGPGPFLRLTEDHSVENEARRRHARGELFHYHEASRQALTRCIGQPGRVEVDVITRRLAAGERYLFCTDGVTRLVGDAELAAFMKHHAAPEAGLRDIITAAVHRGGPDNATGVLVYIDEV